MVWGGELSITHTELGIVIFRTSFSLENNQVSKMAQYGSNI